MKFLVLLFCCLLSWSVTGQTTNFYAGQQLKIGMQLTTTYSPGSGITDITNGLVIWYRAKDGSGTVLSDSSTVGNSAQLYGGPAWTSTNILFNGISQWGKSSATQWPQSGCTQSAWVEFNDLTANYVIMSCYANYDTQVFQAYSQFFIGGSAIHARIHQIQDVSYVGRLAAASVTTGQHFIAFTWSGGTTDASIKVYVDGSQVDTADDDGGVFTAPYSGSDVELGIGGQFGTAGATPGALLSGNGQDFRIYNRALSSGEISTLLSNGPQ